ncbi:MAG: superoxide dismutase [Lachnospiraceae bacterium]|nr:superoxide dismutase [Lachnospiraceae bacterium]MBQ3968662.1 superoxide dismutase [Lachnospiraceae bacterium]MBR4588184.1 superoxide dismutase [Lachnospiraceae bacterium]
MFEQVKLGYAYDALEPYIDALTMETHYGKHHAAYTKAFNEAAEKAGVAGKSAVEIFKSLEFVADPALKKALRNNGGGYFNHNFYFEALSPAPQKAPSGRLMRVIDKKYGSLDALKAELKTAAVGQFGSGWAWLVTDEAGNLYVTASANQDNPYMEGKGMIPLLALDVWEHAYYLKYKNLRASYIDAFFEVLDWKVVEERYEAVINK